jgi:tetrahydromethanopterin S-methyltransferase subunit B
MAEELVAAVVGAIVGGTISALVTFLVLHRQEQSSEKRGRAERTWQIAFAASQVLSDILNAYTPDKLRSLNDVYELRTQWGKQRRQFHILGMRETSERLDTVVDDYIDALSRFVEGKMLREELERHRTAARDEVTEVMSRFR